MKKKPDPRKRLIEVAGVLLASFALWAVLANALPPSSPLPAPGAMAPLTQEEMQKMEHAYVGVKGCKKCHMSQTGNQFKTWEKGPHAKAFETLKGDAAKKIAADKGLGDPSQEAACLRCHVTGYGLDKKLTEKIQIEDGVGCESCHGAGADWIDKEIHLDRAAAVKHGFHVADEKTCLQCHNQDSPSYVEFNYEERLKSIDHMIPNDKRKHTQPRD